jgi:hypothetical protein
VRGEAGSPRVVEGNVLLLERDPEELRTVDQEDVLL